MQKVMNAKSDECKKWSDECIKYSTIEERKKQLKESCFKCLKVGHLSKDCKRTKRVYCGEVNAHHRSLCPRKFKLKLSSAKLSEEFTKKISGDQCEYRSSQWYNAEKSNEILFIRKYRSSDIKFRSS